MLALIVSCAVTGVAFAGSALNRDYDVTYTAKFTADATTENPGYLVFDKPVDATNSTITMTMDVIDGTNLTGKFNFGFALLTSPTGNALTDANSMVWYSSATPLSGYKKIGTIKGGNESAKSNTALFFDPSTTIKNGYSIKVEYVAPTETTDGSIALYTKASTDTDWTLKKSYSSITYDLMPQSDNLYFAVTGWSDGLLNDTDPYRSFVFANPLLTDGTTTTNIVGSNNVDYVPYSNFEDLPDESTATYKLTWGIDKRASQDYKVADGYNQNFVDTGVANIAQGYFGNKKPVNLSDNEALVMEFTVKNYGINEGASFGFGVMSPAEGSKAYNAPFDCDDYYTNAWIGEKGQSIFAYGKDNDGVLNVGGYRMTSNKFRGETTYEGANGEVMSYNFKPSKFMSAGKTVKIVYTPYLKDIDGVVDEEFENDRLGSLIVYTKDADAIDYEVAFQVSALGPGAVSENLYLFMYVNMATGPQSMIITNYTMTTRAVDNDTIDLNGRNVQTGEVIDKLDKFGCCTRKAAAVGTNVYSYYVDMTEVKSVGAEDGDGLMLYADKTSSDTIDKGYALVYYNHNNAVNSKLSSAAIINFDVLYNSGLNVVLNESATALDSESVIIPVPVQGDAIINTDIDGATTIVTTAKSTKTYTLKIEEGKAVLYNVYKAHVVSTTPSEVEGEDDVVVESDIEMLVKVYETALDFSDFYFGFYVEATGDVPVVSTVDNLMVKDDPAVIGIYELDYICDFNMGIPVSKFTMFTQGDNSMINITDRQHTIAVTNGSIVDKDVYSLLASDGDVVTFIPDAPAKGYEFDRWETTQGELYSRKESVTIVAHKNLALVAKYELIDREIKIVSGGKITFYEGQDVEWTEVVAKYGDSIKITADINTGEGMIFAGWYNGSDKISSDIEYAFEITEEYKALEAKYTLEQIDLTVVNGTAGISGGTPSANVSIVYNSTIIATPSPANQGWTFSHWEFNGVKVVEGVDDAGVMTKSLTEGGTLTAVYTKIPCNVVVTNGYINGDVDIHSKTVSYGDEVIITANAPAEGKQFDGWYKGNVKVSSESDYIVTVTEDITVEARYVDAEEETKTGGGCGCGGFVAPPSNGGPNNSIWLISGMLVLCAVAVAIARRNRTSKESK